MIEVPFLELLIIGYVKWNVCIYTVVGSGKERKGSVFHVL